jgi:hypothetical protein
MNRLEAGLLDVVSHLDEARVRYMVFGGYANLYWGRPRLTEDLDFKVVVPEAEWAGFITGLGRRFSLLAEDPLGFARETRVIPLETSAGVLADLVLAGIPYEEEAIERARAVEVNGRPVRLCTAEDLVLHKIISDRPRDRDDVEGIITRQGGSLDRGYLDHRIQELARDLERPDSLEFYRACLRKAQHGAS